MLEFVKRISYMRPGLVGEPPIMHIGHSDMYVDDETHAAVFKRDDGTQQSVRLTRVQGEPVK